MCNCLGDRHLRKFFKHGIDILSSEDRTLTDKSLSGAGRESGNGEEVYKLDLHLGYPACLSIILGEKPWDLSLSCFPPGRGYVKSFSRAWYNPARMCPGSWFGTD